MIKSKNPAQHTIPHNRRHDRKRLLDDVAPPLATLKMEIVGPLVSPTQSDQARASGPTNPFLRLKVCLPNTP